MGGGGGSRNSKDTIPNKKATKQCDQYEPDWQYALYGPNYARLRAIKEKYDPAHTLWCRKCVASDDWAYDEGSGSLCRRDVMQSWPGYGIPEEW